LIQGLPYLTFGQTSKSLSSEKSKITTKTGKGRNSENNFF